MKYTKTELEKQLNVSGIYSVHYFEYMKSFVYRGEQHPFWEIVYADKKSLIITADSEEILLQPGQLFLHKPDEFHSLRCADGAANSIVFSFDCDCDSLYDAAGKVITCGIDECRLLANIIEQASEIFVKPLGDMHVPKLEKKSDTSFANEQLLKTYIEILLIRLIRSSNAPVHISKRENTKLIENITTYLEQNADQKIKFEDILKTFNISASVVKKIFRENLGIGVMEYFSKLKVEAAKQMIRDGDYNFTEIADKLCFNTSQYFTTVFRRHTGMTPSEYERSVKSHIGSIQ